MEGSGCPLLGESGAESLERKGVYLGSSDTGTVWLGFGLDELTALLTKISHFTGLPLTFTHPVQWVRFYVFKKM